MSGDLCCPVCRARFRGSAECSRCGADLAVPMLLAAQAYLLRKCARRSLAQGDSQAALASAQAAQRLHATEEGSLLRFVCVAAVNTIPEQAQSLLEAKSAARSQHGLAKVPEPLLPPLSLT